MGALDATQSSAAADLARQTCLPPATVAKVLKQLCKAGLVQSVRGAQGGYSLGRAPEAISVSDIVAAIDGPIRLTECAGDNEESACAIHQICSMKNRWSRVNHVVVTALNDVTLADMMRHAPPPVVQTRESVIAGLASAQ